MAKIRVVGYDDKGKPTGLYLYSNGREVDGLTSIKSHGKFYMNIKDHCPGRTYVCVGEKPNIGFEVEVKDWYAESGEDKDGTKKAARSSSKAKVIGETIVTLMYLTDEEKIEYDAAVAKIAALKEVNSNRAKIKTAETALNTLSENEIKLLLEKLQEKLKEQVQEGGK